MAMMRVGCIASMRVGCIERALVTLNIFAVFVSSQLKCRVESRRIRCTCIVTGTQAMGARGISRGGALALCSDQLTSTSLSSPPGRRRRLPLPPHHPGTTPQTTANMSDNENGENGDELVTKPFKFVTGELLPRLRVHGIDS
jgi:hypothetical protein